ncbi:hypothetical protein XNC1_1214 [Xenorhabdus nematophila ATCC 19061]|uniref:Uncharacterized protein n=1 Tax=Xenorhabdus nematophila (strain ATCC 19061 / DSM 3370 / CCUG 14189 / LMG 1036 / NCIMB 9965 / AN6) TaxID=406817 RepID=D3V9P7_XENNA|nr:hypothetical protein XNC1_1214 [Xenorhabdus nematophila ATCC 19061]
MLKNIIYLSIFVVMIQSPFLIHLEVIYEKISISFSCFDGINFCFC